MRGAVLGILAGSMLAFGATAANASLTYTACDANLSGGCTVDNSLFPAQATISWSDADVGTSPFSSTIDFNNSIGGDYYASLTAGSPAVFFTSLTIYALVGGVPTGPALMEYTGLPTHAITLLPASFGAGDYRLTFGGTTTGGGGEGGSLTFFQAVPEPSTWAMMLLGFAGIGFAMRRRRNPALAQVA